jgi:hypothetical protein
MEKTDIVYILANASKWQNSELKYSLRSMEKNMDMPIGRIFIVGYLPKFVETREVDHIDVQDNYTNKLRNAARKIKGACNDRRVSENFILMNDDFFIMKKVSEIKYWSKGSLKGSMTRHRTKKGYYYTAIKQTKELLESQGIENPTDYEIHAPIIIEKKKFLKIDKKLNLEEKGLLFRSIYGNLTGAKRDVVPDIKIFNIGAKGMEKYKDYKIISTGNKVVLDPKFQRWIMGKFKKISKYEKEKIGIYYSKKMFTYKGTTYNPGDLIKVGDLPTEIVKANGLKLVKKSY